MIKKNMKIEWNLVDVLRDRKIPVDRFFEDVRKVDPSYSNLALRRFIHGDIRRISIDLLGIFVSLLNCKIEDLLYQGEKKPDDIFYEGDISSLVSVGSTGSYFHVEITENETQAFQFLKNQKVGSSVDHVGKSVDVDYVIELLETKKTERSTYIANFFKVLKNKTLPVREDKASGRFMCFLRNSTASDGYVSLVLMSTKAVTLKCKHSFITLDLLKNYTTFRGYKQVVTPWFEVEDLKSVYGFVDYDTQDFKRYVLKKAAADIKECMGIDIHFEINKVSREIKHIRLLIN